MDIALLQGATTIVLNGTGAAPPLRAGRIDLSERGSAVVECALDGTPVQIAAFQSAVEKALALGERYAKLPGENWAYLQITLPDATVWTSPVLAGICEAVRPGAGGRMSGSQGLRITLTLEPYWESAALSDCPLSNRFGAYISGGINADNHDDAGHDNWVSIAGNTVLGDVPAPTILTLSAAPNGMELLLGQMVTSNVAGLATVCEGEAASGSTGVTASASADAACSGGWYLGVSWSGAGAVTPAYWVLANMADFAGRIYRPVARLRDLVAGGEKLYLWWRAAYWNGSSNETIQDYEGIVAPTDRKLLVFPPMPIPPWPRPPQGFSWESLSLVLMCQAESAGAHALTLDFVQFLPTEGFLHLIPVISTIPYTLIRYDGGMNQITRSTSAGVTHVPEGPGLWLYPGEQQKILLLGQSTSAMDINTLYTLRLQYRQRKRVL